MFVRMLVRAAMLRRGRAASALLAMVVAAAAATAMLNLYVDVQAKLRREFRKYGANVVVVAKDDKALPQDALATIRSVIGNSGMAVPFAYAVARTADGHSVVVAGTDFEQVQKLDSWWSVTGWPKADAMRSSDAARLQSSLSNSEALHSNFSRPRFSLILPARCKPGPTKTAASTSHWPTSPNGRRYRTRQSKSQPLRTCRKAHRNKRHVKSAR